MAEREIVDTLGVGEERIDERSVCCENAEPAPLSDV
jgi:hypothetical protein